MTPTPSPDAIHVAQVMLPLSEATVIQIVAIISAAVVAATTALALFVRATLLQIARNQIADIKQRESDLKQRELGDITATKMRISDHDQVVETARSSVEQNRRMNDKVDRVQAENDKLHDAQLQTMRDHATLMESFGSVQAQLASERAARAEDKAAFEARIVAKDARFAADIAALKADSSAAIADVKRGSDKDLLRVQARMDDMVRANAIDSASHVQRIAAIEALLNVAQATSDRRGAAITRSVEDAARAAGGGVAGQAVIDKAIASAAPGDPPPPPSKSEPSTTGEIANK